MNITSLRPKIIRKFEPVAAGFAKIGVTPNQVSLLSLFAGLVCAYFFMISEFFAGSIMLLLSAILDIVDGSVARITGRESDFGAVFDWIVDKYIDAVVLLAIGVSGIAIITRFTSLPPYADFTIVAIAIIGSLMNTFIKPVVYAEIGYQKKIDGKIEDPLEGVGFFGRPETIIVLVAGGLFGVIWAAVILIAVCTNLSAIQRIIYLYRRFS